MSLAEKVVPGHPYVKEFWSAAPPGEPRALALEEISHFRYTHTFGDSSIDDILRSRTGNCLGLSCLLVSLLRGYPGGAVPAAVAVGFRRGFAAEGQHAWSVIREADGLAMVDPSGLGTTRLAGEANDSESMLLNVVFVCFFNECGVIAGPGLAGLPGLLGPSQ